MKNSILNLYNYPIIFLLLILSYGCSRYEFWDISKFDIQDNLLEEHEEIIIIYTSRAPDYNQDFKYFIHLIAISQKSGDTINLLTPSLNGFNENDIGKVYNFIPEKSTIYISSINAPLEPGITYSPNDMQIPERPNNVVRDPHFDKIADNHFPTTIGIIGLLSLPSN